MMEFPYEIDKTIISNNAFRTLNLNITDSQSKVRKEFNKLESMKKLKNLDNNESMELNANQAFKISPQPTFNDYKTAKDKLSKPRVRFIEEIFWFWPENLNNKTDETILALKKGDVTGLLNACKSSSANNAEHNRAVYNHIQAIDKENTYSSRSSDSYWNDALDKWYSALSSNGFKSLLSERVQQLNDPSIKNDYLEEIYNDLPKAILSINANLALEYYRNGDKTNMNRHLGFIRQSRFDKNSKDMVLQKVLDVLYNSLKEKHDQFKKNEFKTKSDLRKLDDFVKDIDDEISVLQENFSDNLQFQTFSDEIALDIKRGYVSVVNEVGPSNCDLDDILKTFEQLKTMAYTPKVINEIDNNIQQLKDIPSGIPGGSGGGSSAIDKIATAMTSFAENYKTASVYEAKRYADDVKNALRDVSPGETKDTICKAFSASLHGFVTHKIKKMLDDGDSSVINDLGDLIDLLYVSKEYATESKDKKEIQEEIDLLTQLKNVKGGSSYSGGSGSSYSGGSGGSSGGSSASGAIACIVLIIIILLILHFIGIF